MIRCFKQSTDIMTKGINNLHSLVHMAQPQGCEEPSLGHIRVVLSLMSRLPNMSDEGVFSYWPIHMSEHHCTYCVQPQAFPSKPELSLVTPSFP